MFCIFKCLISPKLIYMQLIHTIESKREVLELKVPLQIHIRKSNNAVNVFKFWFILSCQMQLSLAYYVECNISVMFSPVSVTWLSTRTVNSFYVALAYCSDGCFCLGFQISMAWFYFLFLLWKFCLYQPGIIICISFVTVGN